ncbi:hypothetical protein AB0M68_16600 [Streptomyces sp. NPDC051453]
MTRGPENQVGQADPPYAAGHRQDGFHRLLGTISITSGQYGWAC